ncbi:hypothetical protein K466DRAFT_598268 [Polyporus arcularius HHB13444]|uniref:Uncharacterized protein n=1 Tax=Polyporus arcularius HHB13444 TaxID=1314778 RepID=A0A5C3PHU1_9APHY|nr:hypothetical protein K466DRAFT_598268 [Polyporus arcularius HHB13444]
MLSTVDTKKARTEFGLNHQAPERQLFRLSIPRMLPTRYTQTILPPPMVGLPLDPFPFCLHSEGIPLQEILDHAGDSEHLESLGVPYDWGIMVERQPAWLYIGWPGYEQYAHTTYLDHDGTVASIALAIARAYEDFLREAREWEFEPGEDEFWRITGGFHEPHHLQYMRLRRLWQVNGDIYQVDVELVV